MRLIERYSKGNEVIHKASEFIKYQVLTVRYIFYVILFLFLIREHIFKFTKSSFENTLFLLIICYSFSIDSILLLQFLPSLEVFKLVHNNVIDAVWPDRFLRPNSMIEKKYS